MYADQGGTNRVPLAFSFTLQEPLTWASTLSGVTLSSSDKELKNFWSSTINKSDTRSAGVRRVGKTGRLAHLPEQPLVPVNQFCTTFTFSNGLRRPHSVLPNTRAERLEI